MTRTMIERKRIKDADSDGQYFQKPEAESDIEFIPSGCALLDCVLGGGYPIGRVVNIVGDKSTGKTLMAIEASANFAQLYPKGNIVYAESEAAFDRSYARSLGMPDDRVQFAEVFTVEDVYEDLVRRLENLKKDEPLLYIVDSLDALSDRDELERKIDEGTYGMGKPKKMGELFRRLVQKLKKKRACFIVISQVRHNIGVVFGKKYTRSGGKALDFYASQVLWLSELPKPETRTVRGQKRTTAIRVKGKCEKNKITQPGRTCEFLIRFGFGIDDVQANLEWLKEVDALAMFKEDLISDKTFRSYIRGLEDLPDEEYAKIQQKLSGLVKKNWQEIEDQLKPKRKKYG